ncbi:hypothetical protein N431DRAFT_560063 [Stipitochalara longipes BDJ]|nr:hypothetical protein N431DRAFT_560063 [Stipitochalara longipes BDJ]
MEGSTNHFQYEPLNPLAHEIRILVLEPHSKKEPEAQVQCRLSRVSLNDPNRPSYEALSYVWGDSFVTEPILLHEQPFKITQALWTALRYLRLEDKPRIIWVDAICINQENITEREQHVGRMSEVYKHALRGLMWMDVPGTAIEHILPLLTRQYPEDEDAAVDLAFTLMNSASVPSLRGYNLLCTNPVWGRSWIVQELVLAPAVEVVTQSATFNVKHMQYLSMAASRYMFGAINKLPREEWNKFNSDSSMPTNSFGYRIANPPVTSLIRAWQHFCSCRSTDARDRIYALLSISRDNLGIVPDYRISARELYLKVARTSICQSKNLDVLCMGYLERSPMSVFTDEKTTVGDDFMQPMGTEDENLPSWLPPFNVVGTPSSTLAVIGLSAKYNAGKWHSELDFDQVNTFTDPDILTLSGIRIDIVGPIVTTLYEARSDAEADMETLALRNFVDSMPITPYPKTYFTGENSFDAYWRTTIVDRNCTVGRLDHELKTSYRQIAASLIAWGLGLQHRDHPFLEELEEGYPLFATQDVVYGMTLFKSSLLRLVNHRFNITKSGYMAMIPRGAEEGDIICVLLGSQVAHVLRPIPDGKTLNTFAMIGLAYIHGFMDGEVLEMCENGVFKEEVFHLI